MLRPALRALVGLFIGLSACTGANATRSGKELTARTGASLPDELIGDFECRGTASIMTVTLRHDGRFRIHETQILRHDRWQRVEAPEPCDPWGLARFKDGVLELESKPETCEQLGDPITLAHPTSILEIREADARHFVADELTCERTSPIEPPSVAQ
ncbi:MAG: hypothetical protein HOW73_15760 [Polyangiaceae bacterium]|nr:hypothetical protein [Polyangiaceae bacterium]